MMTPTTEKTVREIALENPAAVPVFETLGIDYCCGGQRPLSEACERANVSVSRAVEMIAEAQRQDHAPTRDKWNDARLADLTQYIVELHHSFVRQEIPRLQALFEKVVEHHGADRPELLNIRELFGAMSQELFGHLLKEERVLFPYIEQLEDASRGNSPFPAGCFGSVEMPVARMLAEHEDAGALLSQIRNLSGDFAPPETACPSYRRLYAGLEGFERDLHRHIHLENNVLFPRAVRLERDLRGSRT
jgi:regulator of cell morphogenesis and NO signaling